MMKIFCIGYNKTGSTSLYYAIKELGFKADDGVFDEGERLMRNVCKGDLVSVTNWIESRNHIELFKDVPLSLPHVWEALYEKYPDAIYVLSERDSSEQWYNSISKFHTKVWGLSPNPDWEEMKNIKANYLGFPYDYMSYTYGKEGLPYDKDKLINSYEAHNKKVKEFFKDKKNFISVNVSNDNDYLRLANFLEKKPLGNKFPALNKTSSR
tara:strand:+ start:830 stop:1459 length:630 start_codon:yes stop_codon:yes gene_type:complete